MDLALICPIAHLEYTKLLPGRFCIAPIALKNEGYLQYFRGATQQGYKVILDNGVFEDDLTEDDDYIQLNLELEPTVLVIPDTIMGNANMNWTVAKRFIDKIRPVDPEVELMFVPQCEAEDTDGFWNGIRLATAHEEIQWIGICRDAVYNAFGHWTRTRDQELNRFYFSVMLQRHFAVEEILKIKWHFLGMGERIDLLPFFWFVSSMDTASLFYQATQNNIITDEFIMPAKLKRPKDYFIHNYNPPGRWTDNLEENCSLALEKAQEADAVRHGLLGSRL
ncbi:hypothetical protein LCGC14_0613050 [marine sediment metagenome]|uniref:Uncharacterized protein n=1 Tax=marine sediment metagenome TaxID=412755 RepID=A0A0F9UFM0_9ZZZZ